MKKKQNLVAVAVQAHASIFFYFIIFFIDLKIYKLIIIYMPHI